MQLSYTVYNVYVMFFYEIRWFYKDFKDSGFFESYKFLKSVSARILDLSLEVMLSPPKWETKHTFTTINDFPSRWNRYNISIF